MENFPVTPKSRFQTRINQYPAIILDNNVISNETKYEIEKQNTLISKNRNEVEKKKMMKTTGEKLSSYTGDETLKVTSELRILEEQEVA